MDFEDYVHHLESSYSLREILFTDFGDFFLDFLESRRASDYDDFLFNPESPAVLADRFPTSVWTDAWVFESDRDDFSDSESDDSSQFEAVTNYDDVFSEHYGFIAFDSSKTDSDLWGDFPPESILLPDVVQTEQPMDFVISESDFEIDYDSMPSFDDVPFYDDYQFD